MGKHGEANDFDLCSSPFVFCSLEIATAKEIDPYGSVQIWGYHIDTTKIYFTLRGSVISYHNFLGGYCSFRFSEVYVYIYTHIHITNYQKLYIVIYSYINVISLYPIVDHTFPIPPKPFSKRHWIPPFPTTSQ